MKELKFRAWDKKRNRYVGDGEIVFKSYGSEVAVVVCPNSQDYIGDICHDEYIDDGRFVVEQSTGLKDKNSKEIYEGDILRWKNSKFSFEGNGVVVYEHGGWCVTKTICTLWACITLYKAEAIGNIHENPELLGGK